MGELVRRFATKVLLIHGLAFLLIVGLVAVAARFTYRDAREKLLEQAASRQELVASQTSRAIGEFFDAFLDNLEFLRQSDNAEAVGQRRRATLFGGPPRFPEVRRPGMSGATTRRESGRFENGRGESGRGGFGRGDPSRFDPPRTEVPSPPEAPTTRGTYVSLHLDSPAATPPNTRLVLDLLWRQVEGRATHLLAYAPATGAVSEYGRADRSPATVALVEAFRADLADLRGPRVSAARRVAGGEGGAAQYGAAQYVVVAAPVISSDREKRVLAVAIPVDEISTRFLSDITAERGLHYAVFDDLGQEVLASDRVTGKTPVTTEAAAEPMDRPFPTVSAKSLEAQPRFRETVFSAPAVLANGVTTQPMSRRSQTFVLENGLPEENPPVPPTVAVVSDVNLEGTKWKLVMLSPLDDVDAAVAALFSRTLLWSAFLVAATGGLLVSTSYRLIKDRVRLEQERSTTIQRELDHARKIQLEWLPHTYPKVPGLEIAAANVPASHVSGDFYNVFPIEPGATPTGQIALVIGDVTGHGLSAAMQMSSLQLLVRAALRITSDPGAAMEQVNATLCLHDFQGQFVTLLIAILNPATGELDLATAGHPYPLVMSRSGVAPLPVEPELILGVDAEARYPTQKFHIPRGALLLLYTDGLTEALSHRDELFSLSRATAVLAALPPTTGARAAIDAITAAVQSFRGGRALADDLTLLAAKFP